MSYFSQMKLGQLLDFIFIFVCRLLFERICQLLQCGEEEADGMWITEGK